MAFPRSEIPSATAPMQPRQKAAHRAAGFQACQRRATSGFAARLAAGLAAAGMFLVPGYLAASATDSLPIGILATDFTFLLAIAGWSTIASSARR